MSPKFQSGDTINHPQYGKLYVRTVPIDQEDSSSRGYLCLVDPLQSLAPGNTIHLSAVEAQTCKLIKSSFTLLTSGLYCSKADAAVYAGVKADTVQKWIQAGKLPAIKIGNGYMVKKEDLEQVMRS